MKLAVFAGRFPARSETFVLDQVVNLTRLGHEVDLYANAPDRGWDRDSRPDLAPLRLEERTTYRPKRNLKGAAQVLRLALHHPAIAVRSLDMFRFGGEAGSLRVLFSSAMWAGGGRAPEYDAVLAHFGHNARVAAMCRDAGAFRGKLFALVHGSDATSARPEHYRYLFQRAELILPVSEMLHRILMGWGAPVERCIVQRTGVDPERFAYAERVLGDGEPVRMLSVARLVPVKGLDVAIRAVASLPLSVRDRLRYEIIGHGPQREELEKLVVELGLQGSVVLQGYLPPAEVAARMNRSHLFVLPSVVMPNGQAEGLGLSLAEAMACGMVVIGTRSGGIPEIVKHQDTGLLVEPGSVESLADVIAELVEHPQQWSAYGRRARAFIEREFNQHRQTERLVELIETTVRR